MKTETLPVGLLGTNCYIAYSGTDAVVIDPGAEGKKLLARAKELEVEIKYIFLTHGHFDHVLGVKEIMDATGAKLVSTEGERLRLSDAEVSGIAMLHGRDFVPLVADIEVSDKEKLQVGDMTFEFLSTPGHTEGSVCILCEDVMFSGDTLFEGTCGRCDLIGGDINEMMKSLKRLHDISGDFKVLPGHGGETTLSRERATNMYMAEAVLR